MTGSPMDGQIIRGVGGLYTARAEDGTEYVLRARGRFRREGVTPLVGDYVRFAPGGGDQHGWLEAVLPRTSHTLRPPAANISLLLLVVAPEPVPDLLLVDRLLVHASREGLSAVLCVNKSDLNGALAGDLAAQYAASGIPVFSVSAMTGEGLDALRERMRGELACMAGQSAVGKSALLNALCGLALKTGEVSARIRRGRHTTRHAELFRAGEVAVLDTPGFSLLSLGCERSPERLQDAYPEYCALSEGCRFQPCLHDREPGCAVRAAVAAGALDSRRHERYRLLLDEAREAWKSRYS